MTRASVSWMALLPTAIALGVGAVEVAMHEGQLTTYAGTSGWASALELAAGCGLVAAGLATSQLRPGSNAGPLAPDGCGGGRAARLVAPRLSACPTLVVVAR